MPTSWSISQSGNSDGLSRCKIVSSSSGLGSPAADHRHDAGVKGFEEKGIEQRSQWRREQREARSEARLLGHVSRKVLLGHETSNQGDAQGNSERAVGLSQLIQNREVIGVGDRYQVAWGMSLRPVGMVIPAARDHGRQLAGAIGDT